MKSRPLCITAEEKQAGDLYRRGNSIRTQARLDKPASGKFKNTPGEFGKRVLREGDGAGSRHANVCTCTVMCSANYTMHFF